MRKINLFARYTVDVFQRPTTFGLNVSNLMNAFFMRARANTSTPREIAGSINMRSDRSSPRLM